jgi:hypothetical protein
LLWDFIHEGLVVDFNWNVIWLHIYVCTNCISELEAPNLKLALCYIYTEQFPSTYHTIRHVSYYWLFDPFLWVWYVHHNKLLCNIYF